MKFIASHVLFCNALVVSFAILLFSTFAFAQNESDSGAASEQLIMLVSSENTDANAVKEVQQLLTTLGYEPGPVDGLLGSKTQAALKEWKVSSGNTISNAWLKSPKKAVARSGWKCVSEEKADSHNGPTICGGNVKNLAVEFESGSVAMYGSHWGSLQCAYQGLAKCKGITFYSRGFIHRYIPSPTGKCSQCEIYNP